VGRKVAEEQETDIKEDEEENLSKEYAHSTWNLTRCGTSWINLWSSSTKQKSSRGSNLPSLQPRATISE
jgi:hypothetical protein